VCFISVVLVGLVALVFTKVFQTRVKDEEVFAYPFPAIDVSLPVKLPSQIPENRTLKLGNLQITYPSITTSYPPYTMGTDLLIKVKNTGNSNEAFSITPAKDLVLKKPNWCLHFFAFHPDSMTIKPGEEKILHYFASNDDAGQFDLNIDFWQEKDKVTALVKFYSGTREEANLPLTSIVYGYIRDKNTGKGINGADVSIYLFSGRGSYRGSTDDAGRYAIAVPSIEDVTAFFGDQKIYASFNNLITVLANGYEYYYSDNIASKRSEKLKKNIDLSLITKKPTWNMKWEQKVSDYYGFFWLFADDNWKYIVTDQAKHTPQLNNPTNFYLFDALTGKQLWKHPTGNECWGIDITRDGSLVAAGCHDNYIYIINTTDGSLKWQKNFGVMNREVEFSHDGKYLLTGPVSQTAASEEEQAKYNITRVNNIDFALFNSADGSIVKEFIGYREALRSSKFSPNDSKFVVGMSSGQTSMIDTVTGTKLWDAYIGEFPMFLAIDNKNNTYAAGKARTFFSFDSKGKVRWSYRVPDHTAGTGAISKDGSRVAIGTNGGWVYYLDGSNGKVLWRVKISDVNVGHNAVSMSTDGKYIVVGGAPNNHLTVFNEKGTKIFEHSADQNPDPILNAKWATIGAGASDGTQRGIMGTYTTDGTKIIAAYGDNYIRMFVKE